MSRLLRRLLAKLVAICFVISGVFVVVFEFLTRSESQDIVFGYAVGGVILICGISMCLAIGHRYRGGAGAFVGLMLIALGILGVAADLERWLRRDQSSVHNYV